MGDVVIPPPPAPVPVLVTPAPWWSSKTLWVNALAMVALVAQNAFGFVMDGEVQGALLILANLVLRLITKAPLVARMPAAIKET